jgi:hypothetical protein
MDLSPCRGRFPALATARQSALGIGMSAEQIDELLRAMNQTNVEVSVDNEEEALDLNELPGSATK